MRRRSVDGKPLRLCGLAVPPIESKECLSSRFPSGRSESGSQLQRVGSPQRMLLKRVHDIEGFPIRDPDSTTYTGAIETAEEFGKRIYREANRRG